MLNYELGTGWPNLSRAFLKDSKLIALHICKSSLFHCEIAYGKNKYLKTSILQWHVLGLPHLIGYFKNDFPLEYILTDTTVGQTC